MKRLRKELIEEIRERIKEIEDLHNSIILAQDRINVEILYIKEILLKNKVKE